jgi:hypothetical protein
MVRSRARPACRHPTAPFWGRAVGGRRAGRLSIGWHWVATEIVGRRRERAGLPRAAWGAGGRHDDDDDASTDSELASTDVSQSSGAAPAVTCEEAGRSPADGSLPVKIARPRGRSPVSDRQADTPSTAFTNERQPGRRSSPRGARRTRRSCATPSISRAPRSWRDATGSRCRAEATRWSTGRRSTAGVASASVVWTPSCRPRPFSPPPSASARGAWTSVICRPS